ncbi:DNA/RNA non-specific endonuclease [Romeria aff. gracilis LEGE 07310]|uniref:Endonuclease n=1 Tax=Vasconcelosia minhoensis LEGE 07310 TaxID=915328 RepID=A0A8J7A933_9CYAN|nr:DNA/RNA non-specific endonuclease [Romeria gracilis]MBE9078325.1 DNA/RNA non-specific endonuclease [Romeria aff. gracilis LEGE 07310]
MQTEPTRKSKRAGRPRRLLLLPLALLTTHCSLFSAGANPRASLPPCVDDDCDCGDLISQPLAQAVLDAVRGDPYGLDRDGNGRACEALPLATRPLEPLTYVSPSSHLALGNPSHAGKTYVGNYLIEREQYVLAYDRDRASLIWASWLVNRSWLGQTDRQDDFRPDSGLPKEFPPVLPTAYRGSGYDRGHMVPSGDRTRSPQDNSATFLMSNVFPQTADNNRGPWKELEEYSRQRVREGKSLYVIGGVYGERGKVGEVTVPGRIWKVIVVLDSPTASVSGITDRTEVIAVDMPNRDRVDASWQTYQTTVDRIEIATGYDLLSSVPVEIQAIIEAKICG